MKINASCEHICYLYFVMIENKNTGMVKVEISTTGFIPIPQFIFIFVLVLFQPFPKTVHVPMNELSRRQLIPGSNYSRGVSGEPSVGNAKCLAITGVI